MKRHIYIALATFFVILGAIGTVVPLMPTTPFLLVACFLYLKSSKRRLIWLLRNKFLGPYIYSYLSKQGMPLRVKLQTLVLLWLSLLYGISCIAPNNNIRALLFCIGLGVTLHILLKKTRHHDTPKL